MLTSLDFLNKGANWPPTAEQERLNGYQANKKLFEGKHDLVFKDWQRLYRKDHQGTMRLVLNWNKRISTLFADLLLGEVPKLTVADPDTPEQNAVERLVRDNDLWRVAYEVALDVSRFGTGIFKIKYVPQGAPYRNPGRVVITGQPPTVWFPVVAPDDVKEIQCHVLAYDWWENKGEKNEKHWLKAEIHEIGRITTRRYLIADGKIGDVQQEDIVDLPKVDDFLVVPVNNLMTTDKAHGMSDYDDLVTIVSEMEQRVAQIARILDQHSDPNMYGPDSALERDEATGQWIFRGGGKFFPVGPGEQPPGYVIWDGQLEAAFNELDKLTEQFYVLSETTSAAFGQLKAGLAESGSALRRLMMAPLAKVNRIRMWFDPAIKQVIDAATDLEQDMNVPESADIEPQQITLTWQDGLPRDEQEMTNIVVEQYEAGLISLENALKALFGLEGEALQDEIDKIQKAKQAAAGPSPIVPPLPNDKGDKTDGGDNKAGRAPTEPHAPKPPIGGQGTPAPGSSLPAGVV